MANSELDIDLLIEARWVLPIEPAGTVLDEHAIAIRQGRIVAVLPSSQARERFHARQVVRLAEHALLPGLVNLHTHAAMTLLRGIADDRPLMDWLSKHIWPAEARHVSAAFVNDGTLIACGEMLRGGITCFNDMYFFPEAAIAAARSAGMRIVAGIVAIEFASAYAQDIDDYLARGLATRDEFLDAPGVAFCLAPHAPYTVGDAAFRRIVTLAEQLELPIHLHLHETAGEIADSIGLHGCRPLTRLERLGLLSPLLIGVHAVHLDDEEIARLARQQCSIAHCPTSNLKLGSGIAPLPALLDAGVGIGLGSDGAASNNRLDLWQEMRLASLLAKGTSGDASRVPAHQALHMATLGGARALGLEATIGSLVAGKDADLCAVRLDDLNTLPCFDVASHLVNVCGREHVTDVWVAGERRVADGHLTTLDRADLAQRAISWQNRLSTSM